MRFENEIETAAPVDVVWDLTLDVEQLPSLTPTMTAVERLDTGPLRLGSRTRITQPGLKPAVWTVTRLDAPDVFEWSRTLGPVSMTGRHELRSSGAGCRLTLVLELTGFGSRPLGWLAGRRLRATLATENEGFKARAEAQALGRTQS